MYKSYTPLLRKDFQRRCAYCLTHEFFVGGESGFEIDHHRPVKGPYGRPDLIATYTNLYWACAECNSRKSDTWPSPTQEAKGIRFLDPCRPEDDHSLHWKFNPDGTLESLTPIGIFTERKLYLWREFLVNRRAQMYRDQVDLQEIEAKLRGKQVRIEVRTELERRASDIRNRLEPPIINRPKAKTQPVDEYS